MRFSARQFWAALGVKPLPHEVILRAVTLPELFELAFDIEPSVMRVSTDARLIEEGVYVFALTTSERDHVWVGFADEEGAAAFLIDISA